MTLVTYVPRALPLWTLASKSLPRIVVIWLGFVPTAVLAALLAPSLLLPEGGFSLGPDNLYLWAALPVFLLAWRFKSLFGCVILGMGLVALGRYLLG